MRPQDTSAALSESFQNAAESVLFANVFCGPRGSYSYKSSMVAIPFRDKLQKIPLSLIRLCFWQEKLIF